MGDLEIRPLLDAEHRSSLNLFLRSMHRPEVDDAAWVPYANTVEPGRALGAFAGDDLVGTGLAWSSALRVPGGDQLGMAAISRVGVRADHRRRGALTGLMRALLADAAERGEPLCGLQVSEPVIYGRFGFGPASHLDRVTVRTDRVRFHPGLPGRAGAPGRRDPRGDRRRAGPAARPVRRGQDRVHGPGPADVGRVVRLDGATAARDRPHRT
ncbi:GNAT family N-acetyltransferase [Actinokineospora sp. G85]|uniref:GNAT family N-acetyltransferase n=1 Tax=Actinokineospora sp. G85 TaxID=3406626 RepID=UPI003C7209BD